MPGQFFTSRFRARYSAMAALGITALAGCGGGGTDSAPHRSAQAQASPEATATAATSTADDRIARLTPQQAQTIATAAAIARAHNFDAAGHDIIINTPPAGLGEPCRPEQFVPVSDRMGQNTGPQGLLDRHVDCRASRSQQVLFQAELVQNKDGTFRFARKAEKKPIVWQVVGRGVVETRLHTHGLPGGLNKKIRLEQRIVEFVKDAGYKGPPTSSAMIRPQFGCQAMNTSLESCILPTEKKLGVLRPTFNGDWVVKDFRMNFNWPKWHEDPKIDYADFRLYAQSFYYAVTGNAVPTSTSSAHHFDPDQPTGPLIRCDRGMAVHGGDGCVLAEAAAVVTLSKAAGSPVLESALHIEEAQRGSSPGMTGPAPGQFRLLAGTRAVADPSFTPLTRKALVMPNESKASTLNRRATCGTPQASIINTRPNASLSCAAMQCSCDEFPYATTWEGGHFAPGTTSAKQIIATDNSLSGSLMAQRLHWDRVLDFTPSGSIRIGGEFWVQLAQ